MDGDPPLQVVYSPAFPPGACIVNHSSEDPGGFVDLGDRVLIDPRIYVSRQAVIDMGRLFGFHAPEEHEAVVSQRDELLYRLDEALRDNAQLNRDVEAAEWTLERQFNAKIQNKPGRPRKVTA